MNEYERFEIMGCLIWVDDADYVYSIQGTIKDDDD